MEVNEKERERLYKKVLHRLGAPVRAIELEREQLDSLLEKIQIIMSSNQ